MIWTTVGKIGLRVAKALVIAAGVGYVEYRIKGGEPIRKVYARVKAEREMQVEPVRVVQSDILREKLKNAKACNV